jgi:hypothetical protein
MNTKQQTEKTLAVERRTVDMDISQNVIDRSKIRSSSHCMYAEALRDALKERDIKARNIAVDLQTVRFTDVTAGVRFIYFTPPAAQQGIVDFDQGNKIKPHKVRLYRERCAQVIPLGRRVKRRLKIELTKTSRGKRKRTLNSTPTVIGGKAPPIAALSNNPSRWTGKRRAFGMRLLKA